MTKKPLIILILSLILTSYYIHPIIPVFAVTSTDSADIDPEMIKENIKKRIEQVIKDQAENNKKRIALVGSLNSVTTNSFTLETDGGVIRQASTSASTAVVELLKNKEVKFEDISIGDYIAALGYLNDSTNVLDARRILVLRNKPEPPTRKSIVGIIKSIDLKKNLLIINNVGTGEDSTFKISTKASLQLADSSLTKTKIVAKEIPPQTTCLIIYEPAETEKDIHLITSMLIKSPPQIPSPSPSHKTTPSASIKPSATLKPSPSPKTKASPSPSPSPKS